MKIVRIIIVALTVIFLADLTVFFWAVFSSAEVDKSEPVEVIRIGVAPDKNRVETENILNAFFLDLHDQGVYELKPCFSNSYKEAAAGFIHGSLDLILVNPAYFLHLKRTYNAKIIAVQKYSTEEKSYNHSVLVSHKPIRHLNNTKGMRISFGGKFSMSGYIVPFRYLSTQLYEPVDKWFSKLEIANSYAQSLDDLLQDKVDIIAVDLFWLKNSKDYQNNASSLHVIWTSPALPEPLICVSFASAYYNAPILQEITKQLWAISQQNTVFNRNSMFFVPLDYNYETELNKLENFLYGEKK